MRVCCLLVINYCLFGGGSLLLQELKAIKLFKLPSSTKLRDTFVCSRTSIPGTLYVFDTHVCFDAPLFRFKDMIPIQVSVTNYLSHTGSASRIVLLLL
jgi:hypothetical protein